MGDRSGRNIKLSRETFAAIHTPTKYVTSSDFDDVLTSQNMTGVGLSAHRSFVTLAKGVLEILRVISKPQMIWSNACFIITQRLTVMQNIATIRDWASIQNPARSMSQYRTTAFWTTSHLTITRQESRSSKNPTVFCFFDFRPKTLREGDRKTLRTQVLMSNFFRHIKARFFNVLASLQRQLRGALSFYQAVN